MKKVSKLAGIFSNAKYFGKHVLVAKGNIYAVKTAREASKLFDKLVKEKKVIPTYTFIPKDQSLILICR